MTAATLSGVSGLLGVIALAAGARAQSGSIVGRWAPVDNRPPAVWDFDERGGVTETLIARSGGRGTYSLDRDRLTVRLDDRSTGAADVSFTNDTMAWTSVVGPALVVQGAVPRNWRWTRVGPASRDASPIVGTWKTAGPSFGFQLWEFQPEGAFRLQEGCTGTYTVADDVVTIALTAWYTTGRTLRIPRQDYQIITDGADTTLVPMNASFSRLLPTLRRAPAVR